MKISALCFPQHISRILLEKSMTPIFLEIGSCDAQGPAADCKKASAKAPRENKRAQHRCVLFQIIGNLMFDVNGLIAFNLPVILQNFCPYSYTMPCAKESVRAL